MRAWTAPIQAWKAGSLTLAQIRQWFQHLAFEHLDLLLRRLEALLAEARELDAALVRGERLLERQLAAFHARHDFFQLRERLLESGLACRLAHLWLKYCFSRGF